MDKIVVVAVYDKPQKVHYHKTRTKTVVTKGFEMIRKMIYVKILYIEKSRKLVF